LFHAATQHRLKYVIARRLKERIAELRALRRTEAGRRFLFDAAAPIETSGADTFQFRAGMFDGERPYRGGRRFTRHFLGPDRVPAFDGNPGGEEEQCALTLDSLREVKWWVRNVAKHPAAFWLPTAGGRFYPDFIAELTDGRTFVVEYKGEQGWSDAQLDRIAGAAWERAGGGLFLMVRRRADGLDPLGQMLRKLGR
jgi:type III restriction enzyme